MLLRGEHLASFCTSRTKVAEIDPDSAEFPRHWPKQCQTWANSPGTRQIRAGLWRSPDVSETLAEIDKLRLKVATHALKQPAPPTSSREPLPPSDTPRTKGLRKNRFSLFDLAVEPQPSCSADDESAREAGRKHNNATQIDAASRPRKQTNKEEKTRQRHAAHLAVVAALPAMRVPNP